MSGSSSIAFGDEARDRLIVALDVPTVAQARQLAEQLRGVCRWVKVGLELYLLAGNAVVEELANQGYSVFLDLKFHDIPNTVAAAVRSAGSNGASLLTVHAAGGPAMLAAAAEASASLQNGPRLLAVTVLTSLDGPQLAAIGIPASPADQVLRLAKLAHDSGIDGLVCSAEEVGMLRQQLGTRSILVTPGIRPAGTVAGDQKARCHPSGRDSGRSERAGCGTPDHPGSRPDRYSADNPE